MKKISLYVLCLLLLFSVVPTASYAYTGGLLNGLTLYKGASATDTSSTVTAITDNNEATYDNLSTISYAWLNLPDAPKNIRSLKLKASAGTVITFYDSSNTLIYTYTLPFISANPITYNVSVDNVAKVAIKGSASTTNVYEFDVFETASASANAFLAAKFSTYQTTAPSTSAEITSKSYTSNLNVAYVDNNEGTSSNFDGDKWYFYKFNQVSSGNMLYISSSHPMTVTFYNSSGIAVASITNSVVATKNYPLAVNDALYFVIKASITGTLLKEIALTNDGVVPPASPNGLAAVGGTSQIDLSWSSVANATSYNVLRSTVAGGPYSTLSTSVTGATYADTSAVSGVTYYYVVVAVNSDGQSGNSNEASAALAAIPLDPPQLAASVNNSTIDLTWNAVANATSYTVLRSTAPSGPYTSIASNVTDTNYTDSAVVNGTAYYYVVVAANADQQSGYSNEVSGTPIAPVLNRALLVITLANGLEKEYDLSMVEVDAFISWYNNRANGSGAEIYTFNKTYNLASFLTRKDYIAFSKIETFEVNEYSVTP